MAEPTEPKKGDPTTYIVERKVTAEDLGVAAPAPSGGGSAGGANGGSPIALAARSALNKLGDVWVYVGEADGTNKDKVREAVLDGLGDKALDGVYRVSAKRYVGEPVAMNKKVTHTWESG